VIDEFAKKYPQNYKGTKASGGKGKSTFRSLLTFIHRMTLFPASVDLDYGILEWFVSFLSLLLAGVDRAISIARSLWTIGKNVSTAISIDGFVILF